MYGDCAPGSAESQQQFRRLLRRVAAGTVLAAAAAGVNACTGPEQQAITDPQPISVEINQSRDQYGKQAILLQFTNTTGGPLTLGEARVSTPLFGGELRWQPAGAELELPPGQPKSLPVQLPAPECFDGSAPVDEALAAVQFTSPGQSALQELTLRANDPFGVLVRNNAELCLAAGAAGVADIALDSSLEVAADGRTAVVRLVATPKAPADGAAKSLVLDHIQGTTLLAEVPGHPWPADITIVQGGPPTEWRLWLRPARCDPHAVAEDKVGTLLPLHVRADAHEGQLKVAADPVLRAQLYDFVTRACATE
ncbi:MAG: hypothetical protein JWQ56_1225 [Pseudarthrobacter sp.]|nr:hypothetical protein [Pseudarthrobacter sp.]